MKNAFCSILHLKSSFRSRDTQISDFASSPQQLLGHCFRRRHSYAIRMWLVCTRMSFVCHSFVHVCYPYVTRMYSYVIRMSLTCTLSHPYVNRMYSYFICMSLVYGFTMNREIAYNGKSSVSVFQEIFTSRVNSL